MSERPTDYVGTDTEELLGDALGTDTVHADDEYTTVDILRENALVYTRLPHALADAVGA